jgi:hypothetical protein
VTVVNKIATKRVPIVTKCSERPYVYELLSGHKMRLRYKQIDEKNNVYWMEAPLPQKG